MQYGNEVTRLGWRDTVSGLCSLHLFRSGLVIPLLSIQVQGNAGPLNPVQCCIKLTGNVSFISLLVPSRLSPTYNFTHCAVLGSTISYSLFHKVHLIQVSPDHLLRCRASIEHVMYKHEISLHLQAVHRPCIGTERYYHMLSIVTGRTGAPRMLLAFGYSFANSSFLNLPGLRQPTTLFPKIHYHTSRHLSPIPRCA